MEIMIKIKSERHSIGKGEMGTAEKVKNVFENKMFIRFAILLLVGGAIGLAVKFIFDETNEDHDIVISELYISNNRPPIG